MEPSMRLFCMYNEMRMWMCGCRFGYWCWLGVFLCPRYIMRGDTCVLCIYFISSEWIDVPVHVILHSIVWGSMISPRGSIDSWDLPPWYEMNYPPRPVVPIRLIDPSNQDVVITFQDRHHVVCESHPPKKTKGGEEKIWKWMNVVSMTKKPKKSKDETRWKYTYTQIYTHTVVIPMQRYTDCQKLGFLFPNAFCEVDCGFWVLRANEKNTLHSWHCTRRTVDTLPILSACWEGRPLFLQ